MSDDNPHAEYRKQLEQSQLGELIDQLILVRLNSDVPPDNDAQVKVKYLKEEISRRETGRKTQRRSGKRGIQSVDGFL